MSLFGALFQPILFSQNNERRMKPEDIPPQFRPPHPADKVVQRYFTIDQKRNDKDMTTDEALPRSREFIRIDSTYYVGWMFEGAYKFEHAEDYLGFKNATAPLEKALKLLEHDYAKALATRTGSFLTFYPIQGIQVDYTHIANMLMNCYSNTDRPDLVYSLLRRTLKWNLQLDFYMDSYNYLAWNVHRNRFYTSSKYSFLKNSIAENEKLANSYLDTSLKRIEKNRRLNDSLRKGLSDQEKFSVYHYKNILYSYNLNIDSATLYFNMLKHAGRLPHNNFATFMSVCGKFRDAENEYKIASQTENGDKRLQEWAYYSTMLQIYKAQPKEGIQLAKDMITASGTTPGFGWYNIALARSLMYDGQLTEAEKYTDRAAEFKELHIGTTLGQSHYEFSIQLLKLLAREYEWSKIKFEHSNWWYNPSALWDMSGKYSDLYMQRFLILNQFAQNPERDNVIYKLFSTESTVSWDEIWYLINDFSTKFFIKRFEKEAAEDKRPYIKKYFKLFSARLKMKQGDFKDAKKDLDDLFKEPSIDQQYEKLFTARLYQAAAECADELGLVDKKNDYLYQMYLTYPEIMPYTGLKCNFNLHLIGTPDPAVVDRLKDCNINWTANSSIPAPQLYLEFGAEKGKRNITYYVTDKNGRYIVNKNTITTGKPEQTGVDLAYRIFNIGAKTPEKPKS